MSSKKPYRSVPVQALQLALLVPLLLKGCILAIDLAKELMVFAIATLSGEVLSTVRFQHPSETHLFLSLVQQFCSALHADNVLVAVEPTGTYGDALVAQLRPLGVQLRVVRPKAVHDLAEVHDGVRSLHDGKSAALIAALVAQGRSSPLLAPSLAQRALRALADARALHAPTLAATFGRLEAMLARHWPELGTLLHVHTHQSVLVLLAEHGGPASVARDPAAARALLERASRKHLAPELIELVVQSAVHTRGVAMLKEEEDLLRKSATLTRRAQQEQREIEAQMQAHLDADPTLAPLVALLGGMTTAVVLAHIDPRLYASAGAFQKACGLNVREKSSGESKGRIHITRRGPGEVRKLLYLAALRLIKDEPVVQAWYERRESHQRGQGVAAVVAVMRKLTRAVWHVAKGAPFDAQKLFDTTRLTPKEKPARGPIVARTTAGSAVRRRSKKARKAVTTIAAQPGATKTVAPQ
jgi:transposase